MKARVFLASLGVTGAAVLVGQLSAKSTQSTSKIPEASLHNNSSELQGGAQYDIWPCRIRNLQQYASTGSYPEGSVALAFETKGANAGNDFLPWDQSPGMDHPVIGMNLYRIKQNGMIEQVGLAWLKHAWAAVQGSGCGSCQGGGNSRLLAPGCADTYGASLNADQDWLGPREEITPHEHRWMDGFSWIGSHFARNPNGWDSGAHGSMDHRLRVRMGDIGNSGEQYYIEGFYHILRDHGDPAWDDLYEHPDNQFNNTTHARVLITHNGGSSYTYTNSGGTMDGPIISKWAADNGGSFERAEPAVDNGFAYVASRAVDLGGGQWRYEYAVHNFSVSEGLNKLSIPVGGIDPSSANMQFPVDGYWIDANTFVNESAYSTDPWSYSKVGQMAEFEPVQPLGEELPNNLRYGATYTFWFNASVGPAAEYACVTLSGTDQAQLTANAIVPDSSVPAILTDVTVVTGSILSGGVADLTASDNSYVHTRSGFGTSLVDLHNMTMVVSATTDVEIPCAIDVAIESRIDQPSGLARVSLRNWDTGNFVSIGSYGIGSTEQVNSINGVDSVGYVNGTGQIDVSVQHLVFVPFVAFTFESFIDLVDVTVH